MNGHSGYIMLDVGGTFIKAGVMGAEGVVCAGSLTTVPVRSDGTQEEIADAFGEAMRTETGFLEREGIRLNGVGIASPGPFDYANGIPLMEHKFKSIRGIDLRGMIREMPGVGGDVPVVFANDVVAVLLGELSSGNAVGYSGVAVVTLGTGLGFAFSRNDEVLLSPLGSPAVAIYNLPYSDGILEDYVSKRGILKVYGDLGGDLSGGVTVKEVAARADKGEDAALRAFDSAGTALASALGPVLSENGIECLLFGGQISRSFHLMERSLRSGLHGGPLLTIGPVKSIDDSAFYGLHRCLSRA